MPIRLLTPIRSRDDARVLYIYKEYLDMFKKMNAELLIATPNCDETYTLLLDMCDGLLLSGGGDIDPKYFNQLKHKKTKPELESIEHMEFRLIELFSKQKKPIIGICRGIQTINVFFNGTLIQDIPSQRPNTKAHQQESLEGYSHHVTIQPNTKLREYLAETILVNSFHHQNIDLVAPGFTINAISEDGLIEGIEKDNIIAVQWHPEKTNDKNQEDLLNLFKTLF